MNEFSKWRVSHPEENSSEEDFPDDRVSPTENSIDRDEVVTV